MLDLKNPKDGIIDAALKLAEHGWNDLTFDRIATAAGISLTEFRKHFQSKPQILTAFTRAIDDAVLAKVSDAAESPRERLFDVLMTRFDLMKPYKAGLKRIHDDWRLRPGEALAQLAFAARSQYWMLAAAGIGAEGPRAAIRIPGAVSIYVKTFEVWLDDDEPGLAKTMAALDNRLRQGERFMQRLHDVRGAAERLCSAFLPQRYAPKKPAAPTEPVADALVTETTPPAPQGNV
jgi:ubiquinone biosynthesis protein COQ9